MILLSHLFLYIPLLDGVLYTQHPQTSSNPLFSYGVQIVVKPGKTCGSTAQIGSLTTGTAGYNHKFVVLSKDEYGNYRTQGTDNVSVALLGPYSFQYRNQTSGPPVSEGQNSSVVSWASSIQDHLNGTYTFQTNATISGFYKYTVILASVNVSTSLQAIATVSSLISPFDFHIVPQQIYPFNNKFLREERSTSGTNRLVNVVTKISIEAHDVFGNRRTVGGGVDLSELRLVSNFPSPITRQAPDGEILDNSRIFGYDNNDGTYMYKFSLSTADFYNVTAVFYNISSSDSPLVVSFFKNVAVFLPATNVVKFSGLIPLTPRIGRRLLQGNEWTLGVLLQLDDSAATTQGNMSCFRSASALNSSDGFCVAALSSGKVTVVGGGFPTVVSKFVDWKTSSRLIMIIAIRDAKSLTIFVSSAPTALLTPPGETFTSLAAPAWTVSDGTNVQIGFTGMGMKLLRILGSDRSQAIPDCQQVL